MGGWRLHGGGSDRLLAKTDDDDGCEGYCANAHHEAYGGNVKALPSAAKGFDAGFDGVDGRAHRCNSFFALCREESFVNAIKQIADATTDNCAYKQVAGVMYTEI